MNYKLALTLLTLLVVAQVSLAQKKGKGKGKGKGKVFTRKWMRVLPPDDFGGKSLVVKCTTNSNFVLSTSPLNCFPYEQDIRFHNDLTYEHQEARAWEKAVKWETG